MPFFTAQEIKRHFKEIWESLSFLPAVFNLRFIDQNTLLENFEDDIPLLKLFGESNIFAGVLGPRTSYVRIEIANININLKEKSETEIELFLFFLQLCKSNLEVLQNIRMEFEYYNEHPYSERKLAYLTEIENNFKEIERYLIDKLKGEYLYRIQSRKRNIPIYGGSRDRLQFLSKPIIDQLKNSDGELSEMEIKVSSIGINVPSSSPKIDPDVKILIRDEVKKSKFPGIVIQKGNKEVVVPCGFTEGLFFYTCTLLYKIENKEYSKQGFMDFLNRIYDYKRNNKILINELPENLKKEYQWYEDIFNALFQKTENDNERVTTYYRGNLNFEEWIVSLLDKLIKSSVGPSKIFRSGIDPVRQGISRIRQNLNKFLKSPEFNGVVSKIDLDSNIRKKGKPYQLYIDKHNIFFPDNEKWGKIVKDTSHLKDTSRHPLQE